MTHCVNTSLKEMHTDRIDLLLIHKPGSFMNQIDSGRALDELVNLGKILNEELSASQ